jgi:vancomycin resistance protein YoaR
MTSKINHHLNYKLIIKITKYIFTGLFIILIFSLSVVLAYLFHLNTLYKNKVFPNVYINDIPFSGQTKEQIINYWLTRNRPFLNADFTFYYDKTHVATLSGLMLDIGYDATLSATQALLIGRSGNITTDILARIFHEPVRLDPFFRYQTEMLTNVLDNIASAIDEPPQDALFNFDNGRVKEFRPSYSGKKLNKVETLSRFNQILKNYDLHTASSSISIAVDTLQPQIETDKINSFGIKEKISTGYSVFHGSIAGRVHNVALAASRFNGVLIAPGETLSFNKTLGDVSAATGYQSAYIIKNGRTVLGDGGGVCQVSTTLFRAALNAGLPIIERHAHAYRVHYYEDGGFKPGIDATVFDPTADFQIKNDTGHHILIQTKTDLDDLSLTFDLYGTSDGRVAEVSNFRLWDVSSPPPDLYQDDPTLKKNIVKQVDWAAWGAKAAFSYKVTRSGETLEDTEFISVYRPWQAVYLRGTLE